ncbi:MAG TPA: xanthine dehydrogenase family protein subunit M [Chthoniobacteraceae bacterium]|nr:xanthine dehydrogenase family protein subunit M [Chthoniobacteraceae bacterium]
MNPFEYSRAATVEEALKGAAGNAGAKFLGGGTNLIDLMKMGVETPARLVDVTHLPTAKIEKLGAGKGVRIGAAVRNSDLAEDPLILANYPVLSQALLSGASPQLRNMATTGGNLLQRTRCPYFYDPDFSQCNKRSPGSGCGALTGFNRNHAILGQSDQCIATHPSDMCVAMAALEAVVHVRGPKGERSIAMEDFHLLPGNTPQKETTLAPGELIVAVELPDAPWAKKSCYLKIRDRASYEFALVSAAVGVEMDNGTIKQARIALGGVAHKPWRAKEAEAKLRGVAPDEKIFREAAEAALASAKGYQYNSFKVELAKRTIVRALTTAAAIA